MQITTFGLTVAAYVWAAVSFVVMPWFCRRFFRCIPEGDE